MLDGYDVILYLNSLYSKLLSKIDKTKVNTTHISSSIAELSNTIEQDNLPRDYYTRVERIKRDILSLETIYDTSM